MILRRGSGWMVLALAVALVSMVGVRSSARSLTRGVEASGEAGILARAERIEGLLSLLAQRRGELVVEGYFDGTSAADLRHLRSGTKSVVSLLIGIAIDRGLLSSIDVSLGEVLGERVEPFGRERAALTIRHLLTMSAGLRWNEADDVEEYNRLVRSSDPMSLYLGRPLVATPGERWAYSSGASHLLSIVLTELTGERTSEFARRALFEPLGIETFRWATLRDGYTNGAAGLELRPRDTLRLGELMLGTGVWRGERVVSADWVAESTRPHMRLGSEVDTDYGYHWWVSSYPAPSWAARGYAGQMLIGIPEVEALLVANCRWRGLSRSPETQTREVFDLLKDTLIPAVIPELASEL